MDERQVTITILITEQRGRWGAQLYEAEGLDSGDEAMLNRILTATGDTPLEAAANLLVEAASKRRRYA